MSQGARKAAISGVMFIIVISLVTFAMMGDLILIPVAENLYETYDPMAVNFILSGPALISALVSILSGKAVERVGAKRYLCICFGIYTASSVVLVFVSALAPLVICRALQGFGMGGCTVANMVLIAGFFRNEKTRGRMMGVYNGAMALIGSALSIISGFLALQNWQNVFYLFLVTIPIFVSVILLVPAEAGEPVREQGGRDASAERSPMPWGIVIRSGVAFFIYNMIYCVVYYQIAVIMAEKGILDTAVVGSLSSVGMAGSLVACTLFGWYFPKMKRFTITCGFAMQAFFFAVLFFADAPMVCGIACLALGFAYGLGMTYYMTYCTLIVPPEHVAVSTSVIAFAMGSSMFAAPYVPYGLMAFTGLDTVTATLPILIGVLVVGCVLSVFFGRRERAYCELDDAEGEDAEQATLSMDGASMASHEIHHDCRSVQESASAGMAGLDAK